MSRYILYAVCFIFVLPFVAIIAAAVLIWVYMVWGEAVQLIIDGLHHFGLPLWHLPYVEKLWSS